MFINVTYLYKFLNETILKALASIDINNFTHIFFSIIADGAIFYIPIFLVGFWIYYTKKGNISKKIELLHIFYTSAFVICVNYIIKGLHHVQRPMFYYNIPEATKHLVLGKIPESSFPSDHAGISIGFLIALYLFGYRKTFWVMLPFFILMNLSRIILMLHWPFDIAAGTLIGVICAIIIYKSKNLNIFTKINNLCLKIASFIKL